MYSFQPLMFFNFKINDSKWLFETKLPNLRKWRIFQSKELKIKKSQFHLWFYCSFDWCSHLSSFLPSKHYLALCLVSSSSQSSFKYLPNIFLDFPPPQAPSHSNNSSTSCQGSVHRVSRAQFTGETETCPLVTRGACAVIRTRVSELWTAWFHERCWRIRVTGSITVIFTGVVWFVTWFDRIVNIV